MGLESATFVSQLVATNPVVSDSKTQGDDHLRLLKSTLLATFPNASKTFYFPTSVAVVAGNHNVVTADERKVIPISAAGGARIVTLPDTLNDGFEAIIVKSEDSVNTVTIEPDGATEINGRANIVLEGEFDMALVRWLDTFNCWLAIRSPGGRSFNLDATSQTYAGLLELTSTEGVKIPVGTTVQRPSVPVAGDLRINSDAVAGDALEYHDGARFHQLREYAPSPGWYLSNKTAVPILVADEVAATSIFLHPFVHGMGMFSDGDEIKPFVFETAISLALNNPGHAASTLYDVFFWYDAADSVGRLVSGPGWANSGGGTSARAQALTRLRGVLVNDGSMTVRFGASTDTAGDKEAIYVGTILIDATAGQVTCHRAFGQSRKWGVWNHFNRQPLFLKAGDGTASWNYETNIIRASNGSALNSLTVMQGLAEESYNLTFVQRMFAFASSNQDTQLQNGIGWNSTTAMSGRRGIVGEAGFGASDDSTGIGNGHAHFEQVPAIGVNVVTALEICIADAGTATWFGTESDMELLARWRG